MSNLPKLLWVALPLLVAAAGAAWMIARGWRPSRYALNMTGSALLLLYMAGTAGLGLFWVANQQLPVFDWHYLFGYVTLALLLLHLVFNVPLLWRWLRAQRPSNQPKIRPASLQPAPESRRPWLVAMAGAGLGGLVVWLGLRRSGAGPVASPGGAAGGEGSGPDFVERFHAQSSTSRSGLLLRAPELNWGQAPPPFKPLRGAGLALPSPQATAGGLATLGALMWHTVGVTERRGTLHLRAAPSSGALFSTELYLVVRAWPGLAPGWWHYAPQTHALHRVADGPVDDAALGAPGEPLLSQAPLAVVATVVYRRTGHKYKDRSFRYLLADLGHALQNLRSAAAALNLKAWPLARFDDAAAAKALQLDAAEEGVLALLALHAADVRAGDTTSAQATSSRSAWQRSAPPDPSALPLGLTQAMHRASGLQSGVSASASADAALALPPASAAPAWGLPLMATRRSVRRFADTPLALRDLAALLQAVAGGVPWCLSAALQVHVVAHQVAGLAPGAYRLDPGGTRLWPQGLRGEQRDKARAAALDQDVAGDAAAVLVLCADRATLMADPLGPARGYRHALLEAGLAGERCYLEAAARRLGVCAVGAFYDDEAAALLGVDPAHTWVLHFAAIGVPAG